MKSSWFVCRRKYAAQCLQVNPTRKGGRHTKVREETDPSPVRGLQVSPDLISRVIDAVMDEVREWQSRALERMYPIVIFDALRVKTREADCRMVKNKAAYVALGVSRDGVREVLVEVLVIDKIAFRLNHISYKFRLQVWRLLEIAISFLPFAMLFVNRRAIRDRIAAQKGATSLDVLLRFGVRAHHKAEACQSACWRFGQH